MGQLGPFIRTLIVPDPYAKSPSTPLLLPSPTAMPWSPTLWATVSSPPQEMPSVIAYPLVQIRRDCMLCSLNSTPWSVSHGLPYLGIQTHERSGFTFVGVTGIDAWKTPRQCLPLESNGHAVVVVGRLWGTVYEHKNGYRAEHAEIIGVMGHSPHAVALAHTYALPLTKPSILRAKWLLVMLYVWIFVLVCSLLIIFWLLVGVER